MLTSEQEQTKVVIDARKRERENIEIHRVYEYVHDIGQKYISIRWVIMEKFKDKRKIMNVHLVACGYEEVTLLPIYFGVTLSYDISIYIGFRTTSKVFDFTHSNTKALWTLIWVLPYDDNGSLLQNMH